MSVKVLESPFSDPDASTPPLSVDAATDDGSQPLDGMRSRQEYMANDNGKVRSTLTRVEGELFARLVLSSDADDIRLLS